MCQSQSRPAFPEALCHALLCALRVFFFLLKVQHLNEVEREPYGGRATLVNNEEL